MTGEEKKQIRCPKCGAIGDFSVFLTINSATDIAEKKALLSGDLFRYTCRSCYETINVGYDLLYNDAKNLCFVQLASTEQVGREAIEQFERLKGKELGEKIYRSGDYRLRIVRSVNQLREKAYILECGLDDRVIEFMKIIYLAKLNEQQPGIGTVEILLDVSEGEPKQFVVFDTKTNELLGSMMFDRKLYDRTAENLAQDGLNEQPYVVNTAWVQDYTEKRKQK